jgi:peroxiredoxin (alkyl hydroperoxide reductase subunit C)
LNAVGRHYSEIQDLGAEVLSISCDSVFSHKVWHETSELVNVVKFPMGSDPKGEVARLYGIYDEDEGIALRGRFLIDPVGVIHAMEVLTPAVGRNVKELLRQLRAFKYVREHPDEVTPAGWDEGKKTFKPDIKIAGKVAEVWKPED